MRSFCLFSNSLKPPVVIAVEIVGPSRVGKRRGQLGTRLLLQMNSGERGTQACVSKRVCVMQIANREVDDAVIRTREKVGEFGPAVDGGNTDTSDI